MNWTHEAMVYLFSACVICIFLIFSYKLYKKYGYRFYYYFTFMYVFLVLWGLLEGISLLILSIPLHIIGVYCITIAWFLTTFTFDALSRSEFNFFKYIVMGLLLGGVIIAGLIDPEAVSQTFGPDGNERLVWGGTFELLGNLNAFFYIIYLAIGIIQIIRNAPNSMRKKSYLLLVPVVVILFAIILSFTDVLYDFPGTDAFLFSIAFSFISFAFYKEPRLGFILPFKLRQLTIIHTDSGLPLYVNHWVSERKKNETRLFSSLVQGVCGVVKQSAGYGDVEEIKLSDGFLLLKRHRYAPIACILTVTNTSKILRDSLEQFINLFAKEFKDAICSPSDCSQFDGASQLIKNTFPFVPDYD